MNWRPVKSYRGRAVEEGYEVSDQGDVRSVGEEQNISYNLIAGKKTFCIYFGDRTRTTASVHILVADAFLHRPHPDANVVQLTGDPLDCNPGHLLFILGVRKPPRISVHKEIDMGYPKDLSSADLRFLYGLFKTYPNKQAQVYKNLLTCKDLDGDPLPEYKSMYTLPQIKEAYRRFKAINPIEYKSGVRVCDFGKE